jgi:hypothetical protein
MSSKRKSTVPPIEEDLPEPIKKPTTVDSYLRSKGYSIVARPPGLSPSWKKEQITVKEDALLKKLARHCEQAEFYLFMKYGQSL